MNKEYLNFLKENDPIHYSEMKGDPVTGLRTEGNDSFLILAILLGIAGLAGVVYCVYQTVNL